MEERVNWASQHYRDQGRAFLVEHHPEARGAPGNVRRVGSNFVDRSGWVRVQEVVRPIAFDIKVVTGHASWGLGQMQPQQRATVERQLRELQAWWGAADGVAIAFVLLCDRDLRYFWLAGPAAVDRVLRGDDVPIRSKQRNGTVVHHLPGAPFTDVREMVRGRPEVDWLHVVEATYAR